MASLLLLVPLLTKRFSMNRFRLMIILLTSLTTGIVVGQSKTYYRNPEGKIYTGHQVDSTVSALRARFDLRKDVSWVVFKKIGNRSIVADSVIYDFRIHVVESASLAEAKKEIDDSDSLHNSLIGKPLPQVALKSLHGDTLTLDRYKGKPLLINLWFTNCGPCLAEIPDLNKLKSLFPGVHFIAVTFDKQEKVEKFLKKRKFDFDHFVEANDFCFRFTTSFPLNIVVDKEGVIRLITGGLPMDSHSETHQEGMAAVLRKLQ